MANYFPLIANVTATQIQEIPAGDFLDLSQSGIANSGNILVSGIVSATGNVTGNYFLGNGSQLTGIDATSIQSGTSNVRVVSSNGDVTVGINGTNNTAVFGSSASTFAGNLLPAANITYNLGSSSQRWNDIWLANSTIYLGSAQISANATAITITNPAGGATVLSGASPEVSGATVSATGNITGGNILTDGIISATGNITGNFILGNGSQLTGIDATSIQSGTSNVRVLSSGGNVSVGIGGTSNVAVFASTGAYVTGVISATGAITTGGDISITGNIVDAAALTISTASNGNITLSPNGTGVIIAAKDMLNGQANGVGNIGNATGYFNTIFAKATSAQYADVAEKYVADRAYGPGTVLEIGGPAEVQETTAYASTKIAGVVSTSPALLMNSTERDANSIELALLGRVPCRVIGRIARGDLLTSSDRPGVATALIASDYQPGAVIGKALAGYDSDREGVIEVLVGRL